MFIRHLFTRSRVYRVGLTGSSRQTIALALFCSSELKRNKSDNQSALPLSVKVQKMMFCVSSRFH